MCIEITYKYVCGCRVFPRGNTHKEWCLRAANANKECWVALGERDELWHGTEKCPVHKDKMPRANGQN
jgi:hypothetical protein